MTTDLDSILSGKGETAPETDTTTKPAATEGAETSASEVVEGQEQSTEGGKTVPIEALHAERQKTKRYTEQVASFERKLDETNAQWERRLNTVLERLPRQEQPRPEPPDFFADPDASVTGKVRAALDPVIQQISQMSEAVSRRFAVSEHGAETVGSAYGAMEKRMQSDPGVRGEYQRIMQSGDPWGELVKWHKRESAMAEIGSDPTAYREKLKAEIVAELNGGQKPAANEQAAPVMPSNLAGARNVGARTGPAWAGPTPLKDIFKR